MRNIEERFKRFCAHFPGAENIDDLVVGLGCRDGSKRADYLFEDRTIICEVKTLSADTSTKLVKFMRRLGIDPDALSSGRHIVEDLFKSLQDGDRLFRRATDFAMTPVQDGLDDAAKQIRSTKELFSIPGAAGVLVILNGEMPIAGSPLILRRLEQRLNKTEGDGQPYHRDVNIIVVINEAYAVGTPEGDKLVVNVCSNEYVPERTDAKVFAESLVNEWGSFNNLPTGKASEEIREQVRASRLFIEKK